MAIKVFKGENRFLSNFYPSPISICGVKYPTVEHFFQTMKAIDSIQREKIRTAETPGEAKRLGRTCRLRTGWKEYRLDVMENGVRAKFDQNPELKLMLTATENQTLEEGNNWGDIFWGKDVRTDIGENHLGLILMKIRKYYAGVRKQLQLD